MWACMLHTPPEMLNVGLQAAPPPGNVECAVLAVKWFLSAWLLPDKVVPGSCPVAAAESLVVPAACHVQ
jgi:hypothetical protein